MVERRDLFGGKLRLCVHAHSRISHHADSTISDSPSRRYAVRNRYSRSEEHTSELQSLMRISYAVFCLKKKQHKKTQKHSYTKPSQTLNKPIHYTTQTKHTHT